MADRFALFFREFGVKPLGDIKPLVKSLNKIFAHSDKTVRAEVSRARDGMATVTDRESFRERA